MKIYYKRIYHISIKPRKQQQQHFIYIYIYRGHPFSIHSKGGGGAYFPSTPIQKIAYRRGK